VATAAGPKQVCIEPGWRFDERNAFVDPADRVTRRSATMPWPRSCPRCRIKLALARRHRPADRSLGLAPFRGLTFRLPPRRPMALVALGSHRGGTALAAPRLLAVRCATKTRALLFPAARPGLTLVVEVIVAGLVLVLVNHRVWHSAGRSLLGPSAHHANDRAREASRRILAAGGVGLVTGHTLQPELARVGTGFYANSGACGEVVEERPSRLGLPRSSSTSNSSPGSRSRRERRCTQSSSSPAATSARRRCWSDSRPGASCTTAANLKWSPPSPAATCGHRSPTRPQPQAGAAARLGRDRDPGTHRPHLGVVPPQVRGRLHPLLGYIPLGVSEAAGALVALAGVGLLAVARGVRRGQRLAWLVSIGLLAGTVALHLIRHGEVVQSTAALVLVAVLWWARNSFRARFDLPSLRAGLATLLGGVIGVTFIGATVLWSVVPTIVAVARSPGTKPGGPPPGDWSVSGRWRSMPGWTPFCTRLCSRSASGWPWSRLCSRSGPSSTGTERVTAPTPPNVRTT